MSQSSKFVLLHDPQANEENRRPNLTGEYRLGQDSPTRRLALWSGVDRNGKLYARGKATVDSTSEAMRETAATRDDIATPPGIDLKNGDVVLFENARATAENKQPKFYGYAREASQIVRLAGWESKNGIAGSAEIWRPFAEGDRTLANHGEDA